MFKNSTDLAKMDGYNSALTNAKTTPEIAEVLNQIGVSAEVLEQGTTLYNAANKAYVFAKNARKSRLESYDTFTEKMVKLQELFILDLKKSRIVYLGDTAAQTKLDLNTTIRQDRLRLFDRAVTFYNVLSGNPELLEPLSKLSITTETVTAKLAMVDEVEKTRAAYVLQKGISQNATFAKKEAFQRLTVWMHRFFSLAKVAFKDEPQLMEALGFTVKS